MEKGSSSGNVFILQSRHIALESLSGYRIYLVRGFVVFLTSSRRMSGQSLNVGSVLSNPSKTGQYEHNSTSASLHNLCCIHLSLQVVIFATLLIASYAAPVYESHSLGHNVPVATVPHAPIVTYTHGHTVIAHAPVEVEHHVSLIC